MDRINIGPDELETFIAVSELGSFRRAAEKLGISQPSVTSRVQRLENVLGVKLLNRTTRRVTTTEAGERLRLRAEHTVTELRSLVQEFRNEATLQRGRVAIAAAPSVAASVLPPIIRQFSQANPGVAITLTDEFVGTVLHYVSNATADLAVVPFSGKSAEYDFEPLFDDEFLVVAPRNHPIALKEVVEFEQVSRYPLLMLPKESAIWYTVRDEFERRGLKFQPAFQAYNLFTLVGLVEAGLGLSLLPQIIVPRLNLNTVTTVRVSGGIRRHIGIVTLRGRALPPAVNAFIRSLRSLRAADSVPPALRRLRMAKALP
ncbi:MAG: transcriptional regulator LysR family [Alphaproteobacteria bacterium]|jgi:DNA-binding transcriptional LysR family regulator|nr:transcriptional regulator LysR family [Alphaproteobacteria bacterium]